MSELLDIKNIVVKLLTESSLYRDNDKALVCKVWEYQLSKIGKNIYDLKTNDFFICYLENILTNSDTITRARRKAQEEIIGLRGVNYDNRHNKLQDDFKKDIISLFELKKEEKPISNKEKIQLNFLDI